MISKLKDSPLFRGMTGEDIECCLKCSHAQSVRYDKDEMIFCQGDAPEKLSVLIDGSVAVCNDSADGRRSIVASIDKPGELFGEVFVFLGQKEYEHYAQAAVPSRILHIPREYFYSTCGKACVYHAKLIANMLAIFAQKAYYLNQKIQIISCATLRQKIAKILLEYDKTGESPAITMNREEMADFLNVARPSLSRELMRMQEEGLVKVTKRGIFVPDSLALQKIL